MYKEKFGIASSFILDIFKIRDILWRLRSPSEFYIYDIPKSVCYSKKTLRSLGPKVSHILLSDIKNSQNLAIFKNKIKL